MDAVFQMLLYSYVGSKNKLRHASVIKLLLAALVEFE